MVTFEVSTCIFLLVYYPQCVWSSAALHCCNFSMAIRHDCIFYVVTRRRCRTFFCTRHFCTLFLDVRSLWCRYFNFHVFVGVMWCARHTCFSWPPLFLVISMILSPLSPPNGALYWGMSHLRKMPRARILATKHLPRKNEYLLGVVCRNTLHIRWHIRNIRYEKVTCQE